MATNKFRFSIKSRPLPDDVNFDTPPQIFLLQYITYIYKKKKKCIYLYIYTLKYIRTRRLKFIFIAKNCVLCIES